MFYSSDEVFDVGIESTKVHPDCMSDCRISATPTV